MRTILLSMTACLSLCVPCFAATLQQLTQAVGAAARPGTPPGWSRLDSLTEMRWQHVALKKTPTGYSRYGTLKIDGLGATTVFFEGTSTEPHKASLPFPEGVDKTAFATTLRRLMPAAQVKQVRAGCKDEGALGGSRVFQVTLPGTRPVFMMMMSGTSKAGMDTSLDINTRFEKYWACAS